MSEAPHQEAHQIVADLAAMNPWIDDYDDYCDEDKDSCQFCNSWRTGEENDHDSACLWWRARQLVKELPT